MKKKHWLVFGLSIAMLAGVPMASAQYATPQQVPLLVRKVSTDTTVTPSYNVKVRGANKSDGRKTWLTLHTLYDTAPRWIDEVTFTYYVVLKAKSPEDVGPGGEQMNMFSNSVTYQNVKRGTKHESSMFMDPDTFERFGEVQAMAVVITIDGEVVAKIKQPESDKDWWEGRPAHPSPLLRRDETPFRFIEMDYRPRIKQ